MSTIAFKEQYREKIEMLLLKEKFFESSAYLSIEISEGILCIADSLSDYHEEGRLLMPDVIVVSSIEELARQFKHFYKVRIGDFALPPPSPLEFERILKACAPLAIGGWVIYIEVDQYSSPSWLEFGILNGVKDDLSAPLVEQIFSSEEVRLRNLRVIALRNIGQKNVRLNGLHKEELILSFSTNSTNNIPYNDVSVLTDSVVKNLKGKKKKEVKSFLHNSIYKAINKGHGTLMAVGNSKLKLDSEEFIGYELDHAIDLGALVVKALEGKKPEQFSRLQQFSFMLEAAINNDGITIFSEDGKLLGFHYIIHKSKYQRTSGGARSQAFEAMQESGMFSCCFYKSQDGKTKIWKDEKAV